MLQNLTRNSLKTLCVRKYISTCLANTAQVSFKLSDIGEGIREVTVKEWFVQVGDKVAQFDEICEVQSDKASVTITSRYDGVVKKLHYKIDETALVGRPLVDIETEDADEVKEEKKEEQEERPANKKEPVIEKVPTGEEILCIPSVRRLAKENKLDLSKVKGSGKDGRILKEDVLKFLAAKPETLISTTPSIGERTEPVKGFQKAMFKTMTESLKVPMFVYGDEIKVSKLTHLRKSIKNLPEGQDLKLSFLPFVIKAASQALRRYPIINSTLDDTGDNITYKNDHNIGIAMDTKVGLAVPVIKNVEQLSIIEISKELDRLVASGRDGTFSPSDLSGATFTISNIGAIGGTYMTPVLLVPQVALLALGSSMVLPRFDNSNNVVAEEIVNVSAVADHRIIDGATMARFVIAMKKQLEEPYLLFLNM